MVTVATRAGRRQLWSQLQQLVDSEMACSKFKEGEIDVIQASKLETPIMHQILCKAWSPIALRSIRATRIC